jgi:hypothetical protein
MTIEIAAIGAEADQREALEWIDRVVATIGPGFHFDTPPSEYRTRDGRRLLSLRSARRLDAGMRAARRILGDRRFESRCLTAAWRASGWRYDHSRGRIVPIRG